MTYLGLWGRAFALTFGVELGIVAPLLPRSSPIWRRVGAVACANVASHPAVWFVFPELVQSHFWMVVAAEFWAFASEVLVYRLVFVDITWRRAVGLSAVANGASLLAGLALRALGVPI